MGHYRSNVRDIEFTLFEVLGRGDVLGTGPYEDVDTGTARDILAEVARLARATSSPAPCSSPTAPRRCSTRPRTR